MRREEAKRNEISGMRGNYDVDGFCREHGISKAFFYVLLRNGKGPRVTKLGRRSLISVEAAAAWRAQMEAESNPQATQGGDRNG